MSVFKAFFVRNFRNINVNISPSHISISLRCCANESTLSEQKNPKISDDDHANLLQFIDQHDTKHYDKRVNQKLYHQQKFMQVRKAKLEEMLLDANQYHPVIFSLLSAKSGAEILDILNTINNEDYPQHEVYEDVDDEDIVSDRNIKPTIHRIYCKAIRCCADLGEFDIGYKIFSKCKTMNLISNELYNTTMWCTMYKARNQKALQQVFNLYDELQQVIIENKLAVHPRTYSTLINSCIKVGHFSKALQVIDKVKVNYPELLNHSRMKAAHLRLLCLTQNIDELISFIEEKAINDEAVWADFDTYRVGEILFALSKKVAWGGFGSDSYIEKAENVFKKSLSAAIKNDINVPVAIFNAMIHVYARNNDYDSCSLLLQYLTNPAKKHKLFPSATLSTFDQMLKSLLGHENNNEKWGKVDKICEIMDLLQLDRAPYFYCRLLEVCGDNIERANKYYDQLINVDKLEPNMAILHCHFVVGANHYTNSKCKKEFHQFIRYIIEQHSQYNIVPTEDIKQQWKAAMTD